MLLRMLVLSLLITTCAQAECPGMWMPPVEHQVLPPHMRAVPVYRLRSSQEIGLWCRDLLGLETAKREIYACTGWRGGAWYVALRSDVSPSQQWCDARHEFGHEWDRELTGDANYWHAGWTLQ